MSKPGGAVAANAVAANTVAGDETARLTDALRRLRAWLEHEGFAGFEPHDALTSPLLARTPLGRSRLLRLVALQGLRRLPVNPRPMLGIARRVNAISLGWALQAYTLLDDGDARRRADAAVDALRDMAATGYSGAGWGYYFDWQTRATYKPAGQPIVVSTAFVALGLLAMYERFGRADCLELARSACEFVLRDLNRSPGEVGFCFSYGPDDHEQVFNASMLGAEMLARVGAITGEAELLNTAEQATAFVVAHQRADGSWPYGLSPHWGFVDNFHTGYVLCSLRAYARATGDDRHAGVIDRGWRFYRENFFVDGRIPKYYHNSLYPIDAHAVAQSIVTLAEFGDLDTARRVVLQAIDTMQRRRGDFVYRIGRRHTNRIAYLRWSDAWMFVALAKLTQGGYLPPLGD